MYKTISNRKCSTCKQSLPIKYFRLNEKYGRCSNCVRNKIRVPKPKSAKSDTQIGKAVRSAKYQSRYKDYAPIDVTEYEATIAHNGVCAICGIKETDLVRKLHLDHCHTTGKFRG